MDWHILNAIAVRAINYRMQKYIDPMNVVESSKKLFMDFMNISEGENWAPIPISEFSLENLRFSLRTVMLSSLRSLGFETHHKHIDFDAISKFLGFRYNYWTDDIEHPDLGF